MIKICRITNYATNIDKKKKVSYTR